MPFIPNSFIAFDLETTGFAPPCKIIEIGAIKVKDGRIADQFQTFVNPCCIIPGSITRLTGIDQSMVANAPVIEEALPCFIRFAGDLPIAAHNAAFDMKFIYHEINKLNMSLRNQVIDTLALSRKYFHGLENYKLNTVARHIGVVNKGEHRGIYDAMVVAEILMKLSSNRQAG